MSGVRSGRLAVEELPLAVVTFAKDQHPLAMVDCDDLPEMVEEAMRMGLLPLGWVIGTPLMGDPEARRLRVGDCVAGVPVLRMAVMLRDDAVVLLCERKGGG